MVWVFPSIFVKNRFFIPSFVITPGVPLLLLIIFMFVFTWIYFVRILAWFCLSAILFFNHEINTLATYLIRILSLFLVTQCHPYRVLSDSCPFTTWGIIYHLCTPSILWTPGMIDGSHTLSVVLLCVLTYCSYLVSMHLSIYKKTMHVDRYILLVPLLYILHVAKSRLYCQIYFSFHPRVQDSS